MRMRCAERLRVLGHDTIEAGDGGEGGEAYKTNSPQVVMMEIAMMAMRRECHVDS